MAVEIVMPRLSDSMEAGTITRWLVAEGSEVTEGEPLVEVETDKASVTYESEHEGTLVRIAAREGDSVPVGAVIAVIAADGDHGAEQLREGHGGVQMADGAGAARAAGASASRPAFGGAPAGGASRSAPGGAPRGGASAIRPAPEHGRVKASPLARRIAHELGVDLAQLSGTGPQGRVVRDDVERWAAGRGGAAEQAGAPRDVATSEIAAASRDLASSEPAAASRDVATSTPSAPGAEPPAGPEVEPLSRLQQTVARRMAESRATIPDFELRCEVDMRGAVALREQLREHCDPVPSFNDLIVKAAALALREFPRVNASYREGAVERHPRINVGIAVAAEEALIVPTILNADTKSLVEIAAEGRRLAAQVRERTISPAELASGTFTVSNLGMFELDSFSAVINPPQAAILAVGSVRPRPVVDESGQVVARPTVHLSLACDHRVLYGADGARFLARLRALLEKPMALLL